MKQSYTLRRTLSAILLLLASTLSYGFFRVDGIYYNITGETSVEVIGQPGPRSYGYDFGNIVIPATVTYDDKTYNVTGIGYAAFSNCISLTTIDIPDGVTSIGSSAFSRCTSLTTIDLPASLTSIGMDAFSGCTSLTSIDLSESLTSIGYRAFEYCTSLTSVTMGGSMTEIKDGIFTGCTSLTTVVIRDGVTSIGDCAFYETTSLTSIDLPASLTSIGVGAFDYCSSLATVICRAEKVPEYNGYVLYEAPLSEATLYVPASALEAYKACYPWKDFGTILPIDDNGTGMDSPAVRHDDGAAPYYSLDGKPVATPARGGIYIKGGKKVLY